MHPEDHPTSEPDPCQGAGAARFEILSESTVATVARLLKERYLQPPWREPTGRPTSEDLELSEFEAVAGRASQNRAYREETFEARIRRIALKCEKTHPGSVEFAEKLLSSDEAAVEDEGVMTTDRPPTGSCQTPQTQALSHPQPGRGTRGSGTP